MKFHDHQKWNEKDIVVLLNGGLIGFYKPTDLFNILINCTSLKAADFLVKCEIEHGAFFPSWGIFGDFFLPYQKMALALYVMDKRKTLAVIYVVHALLYVAQGSDWTRIRFDRDLCWCSFHRVG